MVFGLEKFMSLKSHQPTKINCKFIKDYKIQYPISYCNLLNGDTRKLDLGKYESY